MNRTARFNSIRFQINGQLLWLVSIVLFLAPFARGSAWPLFWTIWAVILSLGGLILFARMAITNSPFRITAKDMPVIGGLFVALGLYMIIQIVPFGSIVPDLASTAYPHIPIPIATISLTPDDTFLALIRWATYGLVFFLVLQITGNTQRAVIFISIIFWGIVVHAIIAMLFLFQFGDTILGVPKASYLGDAVGGFVNRNSFATFLAFGCVIGINFILERMTMQSSRKGDTSFFGIYFGKDGVIVYSVGCLIIIATLISTHSRMGLFAACCGILLSVCMTLAKLSRTGGRREVWFLLTLVPVIVAGSIFLYGGIFFERVGTLGDDSDVRLSLYRQVIGMIGLRPLTGYGGDSFEFAYPLFHEKSVSIGYTWDRAHSTYLNLWSDYGLIFGSLPIIIVAIIMIQLAIAYSRIRGHDMLMRCGLGVILVGAVHSLVDFSLEIEAVTFIFVAILATAWARQFELRQRLDKASL